MHSTLWDDHETASDSTDPETTTTATDAGTTSSEQSPLAAAIEASAYSREDIELALQVAQVGLLAVWVFLIYQND